MDARPEPPRSVAAKWDGARVDFLSGRLDEVRFYGRVLTPAEIAALAANVSRSRPKLDRVGLHALIPGLAHARALENALALKNRDADFSMVEGLRVPVLATLLDQRGPAQALLVVTATSRESDAVTGSLRAYLPDAAVLDFPAWETLPHERLSPSAETVGRRLRTLRQIAAGIARTTSSSSRAFGRRCSRSSRVFTTCPPSIW